MTSSLADSKNKDRSLAAYVISFLAASLPATLAVGHTVCHLSGVYSEALEALAILHEFYRSCQPIICLIWLRQKDRSFWANWAFDSSTPGCEGYAGYQMRSG